MRTIRVLFGFLLAAFFLFLFVRNIDLVEVWKIIRSGNPYWLFLAACLNLFNYFVRALRWRFFFLPIKRTKISNLFRTTVIGFAASSIFPAKIGEVIRPYLLGKKENISLSAALATVVIERLFDALSILFLLVFYLLILLKPEQINTSAASQDLKRAKLFGILFFAGVLAVVAFLYYLKTNPVFMRKATQKLEKFLPSRVAVSLEGILDSFVEGLSILHDPKILLTISYWSIFFWLVISAGFWAGVRAYTPHFPFTGSFLIMILLAFGIAIPTPGGVGSYHYFCQLGLNGFFGIPEAQAHAIALVSHFLVFVPITVLGVFFWHREGLTAAKLTKMAEKEDTPAEIGPI